MHLKEKLVKEFNEGLPFHRWLGIEVVGVEIGSVETQINWREEFGHYPGYLHAGLVGTLIETACGFSGLTVTDEKHVATSFSVNFLRPAVGDIFLARAQVTKSGRLQIFTRCDLFVVSGGQERLVANGETIFCVLRESDSNP